MNELYYNISKATLIRRTWDKVRNTNGNVPARVFASLEFSKIQGHRKDLGVPELKF